ncbi:MAG: mismatch-specific DNA-glycosylase [Firmicutes bacterium]|nr:mismatch-specific DNA-glycosylase [Bacillota bacterium]
MNAWTRSRIHPPAPAVPDYLRPGLLVVFIGSNPGTASARAGHFYAAPSNRFWHLLAAAGITPGLWGPTRDADLLALGAGLTDIVKRSTPAAADLPEWEYAAGRLRLRRLLEHYRPKCAAYTAKTVYAAFAGLPSTAGVAYGLQERSVVPGVLDFVLPSPSGRSGIPFAEKARHYRDLARLMEGWRGTAGA